MKPFAVNIETRYVPADGKPDGRHLVKVTPTYEVLGVEFGWPPLIAVPEIEFETDLAGIVENLGNTIDLLRAKPPYEVAALHYAAAKIQNRYTYKYLPPVLQTPGLHLATAFKRVETRSEEIVDLFGNNFGQGHATMVGLRANSAADRHFFKHRPR
jgi:hypothetical protein